MKALHLVRTETEKLDWALARGKESEAKNIINYLAFIVKNYDLGGVVDVGIVEQAYIAQLKKN